MKYLSLFGLWLSIGISVMGCTETPDQETPLWVYSSAGAAAGGMVGGYVGSGIGATAMSVGGALAGGLLGYETGIAIEGTPLEGKSKDAFRLALNNPSTAPVLWKSVDGLKGGDTIEGNVTAYPVFINGAGQKCRRVTQILSNGKRQDIENYMGCQAESGHWDLKKIKSSTT